MGLTSEIGRFLAGVSPSRLPPAAAAIVKTGFTDCVGVMLAGWRQPVVGVVAAATGAAAPEHPFAPSCLRMPAADRSLLYGVAAHVLDYDDTALSGHPSAVLVPAILAGAQEAPADGRMMIAAYAAGYEIWSELVARQNDPLHRKGWHPSAVLGAVAAAGGSAVLRGLNAEQASHAVGIAASLAGGIVANFGSLTKSLQVARAAQSGLVAARLAQHGMTASADAIEHDVGYLQAISLQGRVDRSSPARLGREWTILESGLNVKLYPMCYCTHRILDGMLDLRRGHGLPAGDIAAVAVEIGETEAVILRNHRPQNALDAKFSAEFAMAAAAIVGSCGLAELTDAVVRRGDIQEFFPRVQISTHPDKVAEQSTVDAPNRVVVTLRDGRVLDSGPISYPRGHFKRPVDADRLWGKFAECTAQAMEEGHARALFAQLQELEKLAAVSDLPCPRAAPSQPQRRLERAAS